MNDLLDQIALIEQIKKTVQSNLIDQPDICADICNGLDDALSDLNHKVTLYEEEMEALSPTDPYVTQHTLTGAQMGIQTGGL